MDPKNWFKRLPGWSKFLALVVIVGGGWVVYSQVRAGARSAPTYQTDQVTRGTLVVAVSGSGSITSSNSISVTTSASGVISSVFAKNGDTVTAGQKLADITPDQNSSLTIAKNWSSYLSAKNSLVSAQINKSSLSQSVLSAEQGISSADAASTTARQNYEAVAGKGPEDSDVKKAQSAINAANTGKDVAQSNLTIAQSKFATADDAIAQSRAALSSTWLTYEQSLPVITAPASGTLANFTLVAGSTIGGSTSISSTTTTLQTVGSITLPEGNPQATVNLTEIDVVKVAAGQKVTLTMDAFPGKTFTGQVLAVNTSGTISSGVTSYLTTILFDTPVTGIYPNMSAGAKIITLVKNDVLLVLTSAVKTANGASTVRVLKNGQVSSVVVEIGASSDTQTEIMSGLNEGDTIITSVITPTSSPTSTGSSPFSSLGGNRGFGGGAVRVAR